MTTSVYTAPISALVGPLPIHLLQVPGTSNDMSHMSQKSRHVASDGLCGFIWCLEEKGHVRPVKPIDPIVVRCGKDSRQ